MNTLNKLAAASVAGVIALSSAGWAEMVAPADVAFDEDGAVAMSLTGKAGDAAMGAKIAGSKKIGNCVACHQIGALADIPFQGEIGPALDGAADRWSEAELRGILANSKMTFEGTMMPAYYKVDGFLRPGNGYTGKAAGGPLDPLLSGEQIEDVIAFLSTLKDE
ncbi:sulfur oxidation c-type cytochrome SoxX [Planktotalea sp.]|uniref:sulfur oxidation c-type cytochrome SoxX n=1 Tax=Planktotalea sp. TaxID=2029877 RepID=UPI0025D498CA|nr:sulfur oxidation c-type cytochrome SoxX [Planktotalea sp.]